MSIPPVDTRRAPRLNAQCPAEVLFGAGRWVGLTEDLGTGGCRIVSRLALRPGETVTLRLRYGGVPPLDVVGTVAWTAARPPWKTGVVFARGQEEKARRFVRAVLAVSPDLGASRPTAARVPARTAPGARPPTALLKPREARLWALLVAARSQAAAGDRITAVRDLRAALDLAPDHPEILAELRALGAEPAK